MPDIFLDTENVADSREEYLPSGGIYFNGKRE